MKIISGHQPAYLPWLGYFHKLYLCDVFVYMDTVQFLDRGFIHRNKIRTPNGWTWLTITVDRKQSDDMALNNIIIKGHENKESDTFWQKQHWITISSNYAKARYFDHYAKDLEEIYLNNSWVRLIDLCWAQFQLFVKWLGLESKQVVRMSEVRFQGKKDALILDQCLKLKGDAVVFGQLGRDYVDVSKFKQSGIKVYFQDYHHPNYKQRFYGFEPYMSILDLLMNHGPDSMDVIKENNVTPDELINSKYWV